MRYIPNSPEQIREMLAAIGVESVEALFRTIPAQVKLQGGLPIPPGQSELEIERYFYELGRLNDGVLEYKTFLGAGAYNHYVPAAIDAVISRAEFYTAYTPYQPEVSQGTLQAIFEYQTMVSQLTGMEVTNASMYDGATAVTEAVLMAHRVRSPAAFTRSTGRCCEPMWPISRSTSSRCPGPAPAAWTWPPWPPRWTATPPPW
jgi:glycine dehydrogenase subunit 1